MNRDALLLLSVMLVAPDPVGAAARYTTMTTARRIWRVRCRGRLEISPVSWRHSAGKWHIGCRGSLLLAFGESDVSLHPTVDTTSCSGLQYSSIIARDYQDFTFASIHGLGDSLTSPQDGGYNGEVNMPTRVRMRTTFEAEGCYWTARRWSRVCQAGYMIYPGR